MTRRSQRSMRGCSPRRERSVPTLAPLAADALRRLAAGESPPLATVQPVYLREHDGVRKTPQRDS